MNSKLKQWFEDYDHFHQDPTNRVLHVLGVGILMVSSLGLLSRVDLVQFSLLESRVRIDINGATFLIVSAMAWYVTLDWRLSVPFLFFILSSYFLGKSLSALLLWVSFILGWILQFGGHLVFEKKSPAFLRNLRHVLIGPLWIFSWCIGYCDLSRTSRKKR